MKVLSNPDKRRIKLGPMPTLSRPVGNTCPLECVFLDNHCYAQKGNSLYKKVKVSRERNYRPKWPQWTEDLTSDLESCRKNEHFLVRLLVGGDWLVRTSGNRRRFDLDFASGIYRAFRSVNVGHSVDSADGRQKKVTAFAPTHAYRYFPKGWAKKLYSVGVEVFASIHLDSVDLHEDVRYCETHGFERIAYISSTHKKAADKAVTVDKDRGALVCPEQIGHADSCVKCGFCFKEAKTSIKNVIFYTH